MFSGPPGLLRGTVTVANTGERALAVRGVTVRRLAGTEGAGTPRPARTEPDQPGAGQPEPHHPEPLRPEPDRLAPAATGSAAALIRPGAVGEVPVTITLPAWVEAGDYEAEVELAGATRRALLHVDPELAMTVRPRRLLAHPGTQEVTLVVSNNGNVELPLAALVRAPTDDGRPEPGPDVAFALASSAVLPAATSLTLSGRLEVPGELDPARRHRALVPVGLADLEVVILPRTASEALP